MPEAPDAPTHEPIESGKPQRVYTDPKQARKNQLARESYHRHRDTIRAHERAQFLQKCGTNEAEYQQILVVQNFKCAICGVPLKKSWLDHNHLTGIARGLLCNQCNTRLGKIEDAEWRALATEYLSRPVAVEVSSEVT